MSSHYMIICVSHDPAIVFGGSSNYADWNSPAPALEAIADRTTGPAQAHPDCDLVVGRWSSALIEVCCPPSRSNGPYHGSSHRDDLWIDASWLRLLALAEPEHVEAARLRSSCWAPLLARALRYELGIEDVRTDPAKRDTGGGA